MTHSTQKVLLSVKYLKLSSMKVHLIFPCILLDHHAQNEKSGKLEFPDTLMQQHGITNCPLLTKVAPFCSFAINNLFCNICTTSFVNLPSLEVKLSFN